MKIRVMLVDDYAVVRVGLRMLLEGEEDIEICGEAQSASEAVMEGTRIKPDVILFES